MTVVLTLLVLLLAGACGLLGWRVRDLERRQDEGVAPLVLSGRSAESTAGPPIITVELSDPLAVAAREYKVAGLLGRISPTLVTRKVYEIAAGRIVEGLDEEKVDARVSVRSVRRP